MSIVQDFDSENLRNIFLDLVVPCFCHAGDLHSMPVSAAHSHATTPLSRLTNCQTPYGHTPHCQTPKSSAAWAIFWMGYWYPMVTDIPKFWLLIYQWVIEAILDVHWCPMATVIPSRISLIFDGLATNFSVDGSHFCGGNMWKFPLLNWPLYNPWSCNRGRSNQPG